MAIQLASEDLTMTKDRRVSSILQGLYFVILILSLSSMVSPESMAGPRGEIRVVDSWRPDINVLGHNVLEHLFEFAMDRNELIPSLALSRKWLDDLTLEVKLRRGVHFSNGEPFDAESLKSNFEYQRQHNPGRGIQIYLRNMKNMQVVDPYTVRIVLDKPDALIMDMIPPAGPKIGWIIGAPRYMERVGWRTFLERPIGTGHGRGKIEGSHASGRRRGLRHIDSKHKVLEKGLPKNKENQIRAIFPTKCPPPPDRWKH
jgi:ABC-type transport system substrate-binding protein